jgi:ATP-dependent 26S proteasome regulatory subunit
VAVWFRGPQHAAVAVKIPYVSFDRVPTSAWRNWVIVNRLEVAAVLSLLRGLLGESNKSVTVFGGRDMALSRDGYDWDRIMLDPGTRRAVRDDFETFLAREAWFRCHGLPFRRGYLLYGPPGNGKTCVIRVMASHPDISAYSLDFSNEELHNDALTTLFETAGHCAPSLVILEDLDRLYGKGAAGENRTHITLQHLLNCLDGLGSQEGVIVVAAANDPTALDPAILRRPGRFDRLVPFRPPSRELRRDYLRRLSLASLDERTLERVALETEGFSFAQVREVYILAGQRAFLRGTDEIRAGDLLEAIEVSRAETQVVGSRLDGRPPGFGPAPAAVLS